MKRFHLTETYALINFDASNCESEVSILQSRSFLDVLAQFITKSKREKDVLIEPFNDVTIPQFHDAFKLLYLYSYSEVFFKNPTLQHLLEHQDELYHLTEAFYDYWRDLQRFGLMSSSHLYRQSAKAPDLIVTIDRFNSLILSLYRTISTNIRGEDYNVFRQLPAGVNANLLYVHHNFPYPEEYANLKGIPLISKIAIRPPFIAHTKSNTRSDIFKEIKENPLQKLSIDKMNFMAFPIKVGPLLALVYIHRDFLHEAIGLANLFEFATFDKIKKQTPKLVFLYGIREQEYDSTYYHDEDNDMYLGFLSHLEKNDYFGYLKKMLLTLHNLYMIDQNKLPIHGAMVSILLNNNKSKNIVIIGDSGAGKSETLEALRIIGKEYIKEMRIVFDDMGVLLRKEDHIYANGTETGAFVRLDDLEAGYAYRKIDRAIFFNPDQINARLVLPVTTHKFIVTDHKIDIILYANNYSETDVGLRLYENLDEAIEIFRTGKRKAKGTTNEVGLVQSYFANPFGPMQKKAQTEVLINNYFHSMAKEGVLIGELYTRLAIPNQERSGPQTAARILLEKLIM